jgi:hypothetical protein
MRSATLSLLLFTACAARQGTGPDARQGSASATAKGKPSCDSLQACAIRASGCNIHEADPAEQAEFLKDKAQEGNIPPGTAMPAFEAVTLDGAPVATSALRGKPALVVMLAGHCGHSIHTLGQLQKLKPSFGGLRVVALFVNSGSPDDLKASLLAKRPDLEVWVRQDAEIGEHLGSRLAPTFYLVDAAGQLKDKLVGEKSEDFIAEKARTLL